MATTTDLPNNVTYQLQDEFNESTTVVNYDYSSQGFTPLQIISLMFYIVIIFLGFIGNFLVIFAICKRGRQNVTSLLLCSLALSDLVMVVVFMPFKVLDFFIVGSWEYGAFMCKLISYIALVTPACSGCMLMVISLERYIVILYPLKARSFLTKTRAIIIVATAWVISLVLGIPAIIYQKYIHHKEEGYDDWYQCKKEFSSEAHGKFYSFYGFIILYLIPLFVMGFSYARVILALYSSSVTLKGLQQSTNKSTSEKQNNIYKPQPPKSECGSAGDGQSSDNDPFSNPESQAQQSRSNDGAAAASATTQAKASGSRKGKKGQVTLNDRRQVIVMLMVVVLLYAVCWGPLLLVSLFIRYGVLDEYSNSVYYGSMACHILAFTNSTVNPIVYCFMSRNFRRTVISALKNCCGSGNNLQRNTYNSTCNSRYYSTTCNSVTQTQTIYVKRDPNTSGQNIEMTQYTKVPSNDVS